MEMTCYFAGNYDSFDCANNVFCIVASLPIFQFIYIIYKETAILSSMV